MRSERGGGKLVCLGHMYRFNKRNRDETKSWKRDAKAGCKAFANTDAGGEIVALSALSHLLSPEVAAAADIRAAIRSDAAAQPTKRTALVVADAMSGEPRQVSAGLPSKRSLKRSSQCARKSELKRASGPDDHADTPNDKSLGELNIPGRFGEYNGAGRRSARATIGLSFLVSRKESSI